MNALCTHDFSQDEKEILEEVMNIAFGSASADLGEIIDIHVSLNAPEVQVTAVQSVPDYLQTVRQAHHNIKIIEQNFWGDFTGRSFLAVAGDTENAVAGLIREVTPNRSEEEDFEIRSNSALLEIGNILIGACIGKVGELLSTLVTYSPPTLSDTHKPLSALLSDFCDPSMTALIVRTLFTFTDKPVNGLILTVVSPESIAWMKGALMDFMENY
ncbi:MAG: chemotaxis protein CheC [Thermodesulfobacteriota bacterium]|nr:chemotaxis protein CheC [Thermodesulfobacteriota bacterium]